MCKSWNKYRPCRTVHAKGPCMKSGRLLIHKFKGLTDLIVAFWRAALHTSARKEKEGWVTRVAPVLSANLRF